MRIVTWNVYGLAGYPKDVSSAVIGTPGEDANCDHFATVFEQLDADIIAIQEGVTHRAAQNIARRCHRHLATFPSPQNWPGHVLSRFPVVESRTLSHAVGDDSLPRFSRTAGAALLQVVGVFHQVADDGRMHVLAEQVTDLLLFLQPFGHVIKGAGQQPDFIAGLGLNLKIIISVQYRLGASDQLADRLHDLVGQSQHDH